MNTRRIGVAAGILMALAVCGPVSASGAGTWVFKVGAHNVNPKSDNGSLAGGALDVEVGSNTRPTFGFGYWLTDTWQLDLLAAVPFNHDVSLNGADAGELLAVLGTNAPAHEKDRQWAVLPKRTGDIGDGTLMAWANANGSTALTIEFGEYTWAPLTAGSFDGDLGRFADGMRAMTPAERMLGTVSLLTHMIRSRHRRA